MINSFSTSEFADSLKFFWLDSLFNKMINYLEFYITLPFYKAGMSLKYSIHLCLQFTLWLCFKSWSRLLEVFCKTWCSKIFAKFTRKWLCQYLFFHKVTGGTCNFIKKILQDSCFIVNFVKCLRTLTSKNICQQLFL